MIVVGDCSAGTVTVGQAGRAVATLAQFEIDPVDPVSLLPRV